MNLKSIVLGTLCAVAVMFGVGVVWHLMLFPDLYAEIQYATRPEILLPFMFLGELCRALMMAIIYPFGYKGGSYVVEGFRFGMVMNIFFGSVFILWTYGLHPVSNLGAFMTIDGAFILLSGSLAGIVIGYCHSKI